MSNKAKVTDSTGAAAPPAGAAELTNEAKALADILLWSKGCPPWQRDALRRLCQKEELDAGDIGELIRLCKGDPALKAAPLSAGHVRDLKASAANVSIRSIHSAHYVNALAQGERLGFDKIGLTVIYGDNGSGKSGYARILKKVCRARLPKDDTIIPNIYASTTGTPSAAIEFSVDGQNRQTAWTNGQPGDPFLSSVSVFDCHTANVHVDQTNDVAYTPFPMKILEGLANLCLMIKQRLGAEIHAIEQQTPSTLNWEAGFLPRVS